MKHARTQTHAASANKTAAPIAPGDCGAEIGATLHRVKQLTTTAPVAPGETGASPPEFGRIPDVTRLYGLRRGFIYGLINEGKIKSVCLRKPGAKTGVRLIHLQSVRDFLLKQLDGTKESESA